MDNDFLMLDREVTFPSVFGAVEVGGSFCLGVAIGTFVGVVIH